MLRSAGWRRFLVCVPAAIPFLAIAILLAPYAWPPDRVPISTWSDLQHQHAPMVALLAGELADHGELPRWNPEDFGGMPAIGDPQAGVYNPVYWMLALASSPHAFGIAVIGYALLGALGFIAYARQRGVTLVGAAAGAIIFTLGGNLLMRVLLLGHTVYEPFYLLPLALWTMERTAAHPHGRRVAATAFVVALLLVTLHPQIMTYTAALLLVLGIGMVRRAGRPLAAFLALAAAALLGMAIAAVHLLPIVELAGEFSRARPEFFDPARWQPARFIDGTWLADAIAGSGAAVDDIQGEGHFYLGAAALVLVVPGVLAWPRGGAQAAVARTHALLAGALLAYAGGLGIPVEAALGRILGFPPFRIPARTLLVLGLPVAMLVALGVDALRADPPGRRRAFTFVSAAGAALALAVHGTRAVHALALGTVVVAAVLLDVVARRRVEPAAPSRAGLVTMAIGSVCIAALAFDTGSVLAPAIRTAPLAEVTALPPNLTLTDDLGDAVRIAQLERDSYRPGLPQLVVRARRLETLGGFNSLIPWRFVLYASYAGGFDPFAEPFDVQVPLAAPAAPQLLDLLGVTHLLWLRTDGSWRWQRQPGAFARAYTVPGPIVVGGNVDDDPGTGGEIAGEIGALGRLATLDARRTVLLHGRSARAALAAAGIAMDTPLEPFGAVPLVERTANRIVTEVETERPAVLVFNEPFSRGWRAWRNGSEQPVLRANVLFRAVLLPAGRHRVVLEFSPLSWRIGYWLSLGALLLAGAALFHE